MKKTTTVYFFNARAANRAWRGVIESDRLFYGRTRYDYDESWCRHGAIEILGQRLYDRIQKADAPVKAKVTFEVVK